MGDLNLSWLALKMKEAKIIEIPFYKIIIQILKNLGIRMKFGTYFFFNYSDHRKSMFYFN